MDSLWTRITGLIAAAALPATVAGIMYALERWDWQVLAMVVVLSAPLYTIGRDSTRLPSRGD